MYIYTYIYIRYNIIQISTLKTLEHFETVSSLGAWELLSIQPTVWITEFYQMLSSQWEPKLEKAPARKTYQPFKPGGLQRYGRENIAIGNMMSHVCMCA